MIFKLKTSIKTLTSSLAIAMALSTNAFAIGGNDPIEGIDIIIKKVPASRPATSGSFDEKEIDLTYNVDPEKLRARIGDLLDKTLKANGYEFGNNWRLEADASTVWNDLGKQTSDGDAGVSSFSYPSADGKSKMTIVIGVQGDESELKSRGDFRTYSAMLNAMASRDDEPRSDWAWEIARTKVETSDTARSKVADDNGMVSKYVGETSKNLSIKASENNQGSADPKPAQHKGAGISFVRAHLSASAHEESIAASGDTGAPSQSIGQDLLNVPMGDMNVRKAAPSNSGASTEPATAACSPICDISDNDTQFGWQLVNQNASTTSQGTRINAVTAQSICLDAGVTSENLKGCTDWVLEDPMAVADGDYTGKVSVRWSK